MSLPYIPDKKMYAAVMGACKYIRNTGFFNKAIAYYSEKYEVDEDKLIKYVRLAQSEGQKRANKKSPRTYKHYLIFGCQFGERNGQYIPKWHYVKAINDKNAISQLQKDDVDSEYGHQFTHEQILEFNSKKEATDYYEQNCKI